MIDEPDDNIFKRQLGALKKYLGIITDTINNNNNNNGNNKIILAAKKMEEIANKHLPYEQESNNAPEYKRTAETPEALSKMDCSEFVSRYLKELGLFEKVPYFTTADMASENFKDKYKDKFQFVIGSENSNFMDIKTGDIFLWRNSGGGHTGIVKSYDKTSDKVTVMESLTNSREEGGNKNICQNCTRVSVYSRYNQDLEKAALAGHKGWIGYFRPVIK